MKTIALMVEFSRRYGRSLIEGIAAFAQENRNWILRPLSPDMVTLDVLHKFDGAIARIGDNQLEALFLDSGLPTVDVFCRKPCHSFGMVDSNHAAIGRLAADFFFSRGFTNFAFCGTPGIPFSDQRSAAFCDALSSKSGVSICTYESPLLFSINDSLSSRERPDSNPDFQNLKRWAKSLPKPVAVFCCNDFRALQLLRVALRIGFRVPEDIAILGVDDDTILCSFAQVPLSSINPNSFTVGYDAARMLASMMDGSFSNRPHSVNHVPPGEIIERASTEFKPINPPWLGTALIQIEKNMRRHLFSASDVFALSGKSIAFVEKTFRKRFGMTVQRYINEMRLQEAKRLLKEGKLQVTEIAYRCGYSSPQYFCRRFKVALSISPKRYSAVTWSERPPKHG